MRCGASGATTRGRSNSLTSEPSRSPCRGSGSSRAARRPGPAFTPVPRVWRRRGIHPREVPQARPALPVPALAALAAPVRPARRRALSHAPARPDHQLPDRPPRAGSRRSPRDRALRRPPPAETEMLQAMRRRRRRLASRRPPRRAIQAAGDLRKPLISCLCPTFGRCGSAWQHLLEEAVESFLRQTDAHSELLILNDHPAQELVFDHPRVRVVNHPSRFHTLGEKYNAMVSLAAGSSARPLGRRRHQPAPPAGAGPRAAGRSRLLQPAPALVSSIRGVSTGTV